MHCLPFKPLKFHANTLKNGKITLQTLFWNWFFLNPGSDLKWCEYLQTLSFVSRSFRDEFSTKHVLHTKTAIADASIPECAFIGWVERGAGNIHILATRTCFLNSEKLQLFLQNTQVSKHILATLQWWLDRNNFKKRIEQWKMPRRCCWRCDSWGEPVEKDPKKKNVSVQSGPKSQVRNAG